MRSATIRLGRAKKDRVIGVSLDMLLEILRTLEGLTAEITLVRLQRNVDANMRSDVIALHSRCTAVAPLACQVEVVGALTTNMTLTNMVLRDC